MRSSVLVRHVVRCLALCVALVAGGAAAKLKVAVLPLEAVGDATAENATWMEGKLRRELAVRGATVITGELVVAAMAKAGAKSTRGCDNDCLLAVGRTLGVDRVIGPWLSLQHHFTKEGTAWVWHLDQVNVPAGKPWGVFEKTCLCAEKSWDIIAGQQVEKVVAYDPTKELSLPAGAPKAAVTKGPHDEPGMVFVPAGPFIMGTDRGEWHDEEPRHLVDLSAYFIDQTEVTNAQYDTCVAARKCSGTGYRRDPVLGRPDHPVAAASWDNATAFCAFAGKRLPTEAEWEKAARGTDERVFPWGNLYDGRKLNHKSADDGFDKSAPVGSFKAGQSPYGAFDMAGNVWEWTADFYSQNYFKHSPVKDPTGPAGGVKRAMRGGSWMYDPPFFHTSHNRSPGRPQVHKRYVGFRCAKSP